ncbi:hypothetical protein ACFRAQ_35860 [Nocardia sp. NPDC056611]|uniref:hypothetical protein n=1 Tax=Nocardia sp. NPDC056611 TaxID=3345877 RepID=UPI00366E5215
MSEFAVGGPIPADAPPVQLVTGCTYLSSAHRQQLGNHDPNLLKRFIANPVEQSDDGQS